MIRWRKSVLKKGWSEVPRLRPLSFPHNVSQLEGLNIGDCVCVTSQNTQHRLFMCTVYKAFASQGLRFVCNPRSIMQQGKGLGSNPKTVSDVICCVTLDMLLNLSLTLVSSSVQW